MITSVIQKKVSDLTPVERKIASFVLKEPKKVIRMTVHQVAESCGVAPSAITRFCKSVKVAGFAELKIVLAQELGAVKNDSLPPAFEQGDGTKVVVRKVFCSEIQTLRDTVELLDLDAVEGIVSAPKQCKTHFCIWSRYIFRDRNGRAVPVLSIRVVGNSLYRYFDDECDSG